MGHSSAPTGGLQATRQTPFAAPVSTLDRRETGEFFPTDETVAATVIQRSTRGTVDSHNWSLRPVEPPLTRSYHVLDYG